MFGFFWGGGRECQAIQKQMMPSATYICHLYVSHVFDDISGKGDEHRLDRKAPCLHCAHPQN